MKTMNSKKKDYIPPKIKMINVALEHSIAASSVTLSPGGGGTNNQPWITEEEVETVEKDWVF